MNGGHTLMGRAIISAVAERLGNAIAAPVLPVLIDTNPEWPGTVGITSALYAQINEQVTEQLIKDGFRNVVLMVDHGGGLQDLVELAKRLDAKHAQTVVFCGDVYRKAGDDIGTWLTANGYPPDGHAGISDTSLMLYLGGNNGWVRKELVPSALGDMPLARGQQANPATPRVDNGITGDARRATVEIGKRYFDMKVEYRMAPNPAIAG